MDKLVHVFSPDGEEYLGNAFIVGVKYIKGEFGWFTSLDLLTLKGERLDGWRYCIYPHTPLLDVVVCEEEGGRNEQHTTEDIV